VAIFVAIPAKKFGHKRKNIFAGEKILSQRIVKIQRKNPQTVAVQGFLKWSWKGDSNPREMFNFS